MTSQTYAVKGMTCGGCVRHVEKALKNTPGVTAVTVDLASATATVDGTATFEALAAQVSEAGYDLASGA